MPRLYKPNQLKANNISEVVANKNKLLSTPFRVNQKGNFYLVNGQEIPQKEFEALYPTQLLKLSEKGINPNRRKHFF